MRRLLEDKIALKSQNGDLRKKALNLKRPSFNVIISSLFPISYYLFPKTQLFNLINHIFSG